jgi:FHS family Na+ dependent glucose MFS transporter 1
MGFGTGLTGSTLLKLGEQTNSTVDELTSIFFTRSCGFLGGTTLAGMLIDRFRDFGNTFLAIAALIMTATTFLVPFIHRLVLLLPLQLAWGLAAGIVENLTQVLTMRNYSHHNVGPYLQALHSAFGIGAFISPLIVAQFMSDRQDTNQWHYAYFIIFLLHLPDLIWLSCYSGRNEWHEKLKSYRHTPSQENEEFLNMNRAVLTDLDTENKKKPVKSRLLFVVLLAFFIFCYVGCEYGFISYLHSYAILHLRFSTDTAAYLNAAFWASLVVGRLCGILVSIRLSPQKMIFGDLMGCLASFILLLVFNKLPLVLWVGSILFGLFIASIYSSTTAYAQKHITVTGKRMSVLTVAASIGDATIPLLMGISINSTFLGYPSYILIALSIIVLASVLFSFNVLCIARSLSSSNPSIKVKCKAESEKSKQMDSSIETNLRQPEVNISAVDNGSV